MLLSDLGYDSCELSVLLTDDFEIQSLNKEYRKKNKPTDVLSFSMGDERMLGDIVISVDTALEQANRLGHELSDECLRLLIHGLLHLLGYEHENVSAYQASKMKKKERELYQTIVKKYPEFFLNR